MVDIFLERLIEFICGIIPSLPFPAVRMRLKEPDDIGFIGSEWTTWKEWYGDLNQYFHVQVHNPVFYYCQRKMASRSIDINYDQARVFFIGLIKSILIGLKNMPKELRILQSCRRANPPVLSIKRMVAALGE